MENSFINMIGSHVLLNPEKTAIAHEFRRITYRELWTDVLKTEKWIRQKRVCAGEWVAISVNNQYLHILLSIALVRLDCSQVCLPTFNTSEANQIIADLLPLNWQIVEGDFSRGTDRQCTNIELILETFSLEHSGNYSGESLSSTCIVFTSSGTTGKQKLIPITYDALLDAMAFGWNSSQVFHQRTSVEYGVGKKGIWRALVVGGTVVTSKNGDFHDIIEVCKRYGVTDLLLTVRTAEGLLDQFKSNTKLYNYLKNVKLCLFGSKVSLELFENVYCTLSRQLVISYSTSESGPITWAGLEDLTKNENSVGYAATGVSIQIVDQDHNPVSAGTLGLIGVKSDACIKGYLFDDELNTKHFRDGWFYPGDVGCLTEDGMLLFNGRTDDMMIMNSINIFPAEIEKIAGAYPGVEECVAFPIKSEAHGSIPALVVTSKRNLDTNDLKIFCTKMLGIRSPKKVFQVNNLPRNSQGKVLRRELSEIYGKLVK